MAVCQGGQHNSLSIICLGKSKKQQKRRYYEERLQEDVVLYDIVRINNNIICGVQPGGDTKKTDAYNDRAACGSAFVYEYI